MIKILQELNLDLVQFPRAVLVSEVRVVPLGTRVQVDVPGGVRLGYVANTNLYYTGKFSCHIYIFFSFWNFSEKTID